MKITRRLSRGVPLQELAVTTEHRMKEDQVEDQTAQRLFDKLEAVQGTMSFSKGAIMVIGLSQTAGLALLAWMLTNIIELRESKAIFDYRLTKIEEVQNATP